MESLRAALPFVLLVLGACGGSPKPPWVTAECSGDAVTIRGAAAPGTHSTLFLGRPRTADRPPRAGTEDIAFDLKSEEQTGEEQSGVRALAGPALRGTPSVELTFPLASIAEGFHVLQWITFEHEQFGLPVAGVSEPVYILRRGGDCEVLGAGSYLWRAHRGTWVALAAAAGILLVLAFQRWAAPRLLAVVVAVTGTGAALVFVGMRAMAPDHQGALDFGVHLPGFHVTSDWTFGGDSEERVLGPGFRELVGLIRDHRRPGEGLCFHITDDQQRHVPLARFRASYLRREFPDGEMVSLRHTKAGPGLAVHFGSMPDGAVLARGRIAVLTRIESEAK
jgi:hypothetical protein